MGTPRNSFSRETRTQDKADGQLQKRIFDNSLCAHSEGTHITSLKSCPKCELSLSLHLLQALQPSSNLVQTLLRPQRKMGTPGLASLAPPLVSPLQLNRPHQASPRAAGVEAKAVPSPKAAAARPRPAELLSSTRVQFSSTKSCHSPRYCFTEMFTYVVSFKPLFRCNYILVIPHF